MMAIHSASQSPRPRPMRTVEDLLAEMHVKLEQEFCVKLNSPYNIVVEGQTDRDYLLFAADQVKSRYGQDWLCVSLPEAGHHRIEVVTPGSPGFPDRGGVKRVKPLAEELVPYVFTLEAIYGLAFVLDFDDAGEEAQNALKGCGYRDGLHVFMLHPKLHPKSCYQKKGACIEDLLSLSIQKRFFEQGGAYCRVHYEAGQPRRFAWEHPSKDGLRDFVRSNGKLEDVWEVVRLLYRVRSAWGLPTEEIVQSS